MAFDITNKVLRVSDFVAQKKFEITDATATSSAQDFVTPMKNFRAYVRASAFTEGDAGLVSSIGLEVSDVANFASNIDTLAVVTVIPASQAGLPTFLLQGTTPLVAGKQFARISFSAGTNATINYDAIIEAAP